MDLYVETRETNRLADRIQSATDEALLDVSDYALGDEGKNKSYRSALSNLKRAKKCYEKAGLVDQWDSLVEDIRQRHRLKTSFMPKFEKIVLDEPAKDSSFLDAARERWSSQRARHS